MKIFDVNHRQVQLALVLKLSQCQRNNLETLTYDEVEKIFDRLVWRHRKPQSLHEAVNEIFQVSIDQMIVYLAKIIELESYQKNIDDYKELYVTDED